MKQARYTATEVLHDARRTKQVEKCQDVQVMPGFGEHTVLNFKGKGNQVPGGAPTTLVVKFK